MYTRVKTDAEINAMRTGGAMLGEILAILRNEVKAGVSTKALNDIALKELKSRGGEPAFLGYNGFPESICISVNEEVVHGIPKKDKYIANGDLVSLDFGVLYKGMITDGAITLICGQAEKRLTDLVNYTEQALLEGISTIRDGCHVGDIGFAIEKVLNKQGYGIIRDLVGHGVGHAVHEDPNIPNYGKKNTGPQLTKGMTVAIEPMATLGREAVIVGSDGWTVSTQDESLSAHFEHTVLVTEDSCEVLTLAPQTP